MIAYIIASLLGALVVLALCAWIKEAYYALLMRAKERRGWRK